MKELLIKTIALLIVITFIGSTSMVFAANNYSCTVEISADKTEIQPGQTVTFTVRAKNINAGTGIATLNMIADVDNKSAFQPKSGGDEDDIVTAVGSDDGKWSVTSVIENMIFAQEVSLEGTKTDQDLVKIKLTAKSDASAGSYSVSFKDITFASGDGESFSVSNQSKTIKIASSVDPSPDDPDDPTPDDPDDPSDPDDPDDPSDPDDPDDPSDPDDPEELDEPEEPDEDYWENTTDDGSDDSQSSGKIDQQTSPGVIPYAGLIGLSKILLFISAVGASVVFYRKHRKWNGI